MISLIFLVVSSIIGAGFATGAELSGFFGSSSVHPILIALMIGLMLVVICGLVLWLCDRGFNPPKWIFMPVYFVFFVAMTAGVVSLGGIITGLVALGLCIVIVLFGFDRLIQFNKYIIIFVLFTLVLVTLPRAANVGEIEYGNRGLFSSFGMVLLYAGLNTCMLFPLVKKAREKLSSKQVMISFAVASAVIAIFVFIILLAIHDVQSEVMPILAIRRNLFTISAVLLSVFTSMFIALFNLHESGNTIKNQIPNTQNKMYPVLKLVTISAFAFAVSMIGFSNVIGWFYPVVGGFMISFVSCVSLWYCVRHCSFLQKRRHQSRALDHQS
ncbi:MAG: hypothetical protein FWE01_00935 [Firmicutes bacterium]|nr:hypothetical protein [Bacillota bacterium]